MSEEVVLRREVFDRLIKSLRDIPIRMGRAKWEDFFCDMLTIALLEDEELLKNFLKVLFNKKLNEIDLNNELSVNNRERIKKYKIDILVTCGNVHIGIESKILKNPRSENQLYNYISLDELDYLAYIRKDQEDDNGYEYIKDEISGYENKYLEPQEIRYCPHFLWRDFKDVFKERAEAKVSPFSEFFYEIFLRYNLYEKTPQNNKQMERLYKRMKNRDIC